MIRLNSVHHTRRLLASFLGVAACLVAGTAAALAAADYTLGPDSEVQAGVPQGTVTQSSWKSEKVFPGTVRDTWTYVPKQYDGLQPACVMVFQDGGSYVNVKGQFRVPVVFDNLIHKKQMPVTIGIFLSPGTIPPPMPTRSRGRTAASNTTAWATSTPGF